MNNSINKHDNFLEEDKRIDKFLKYYILIVVGLIFISYINILPRALQEIVTERIPGVSGILIPVTDEYFRVIIEINNFQLLIAAITALLSFIFIIWRRNIYEVLGVLALGMLPRERKVWGVVRDKNTLATLPFSQIRLLKESSDNKETQESQTVADLDGRYRIQIKDKTSKYFLEVRASGFKPYKQEINFINTLISSDLIIDDVLLEQENTEKKSLRSKFNSIRPRMYNLLIWFIFISYIVNIPIAIFATINNPILINWLFIITVIVTTAWNIKIIRERYYPNVHRFLNKEGVPLKDVTIDIYDNKSKLTSSTTNSEGIAKFDIEPGNYLVKDLNNQFTPIRINSKGYIQDDMKLSIEMGNIINNPFG